MKNMSLGHTTKSCILSFMLVVASMAFVIPGALAAEFTAPAYTPGPIKLLVM